MKTVFMIVFICVVSLSVNARVYKWKDEKGRWHMSDTPPADKKKNDLKEIKVDSSGNVMSSSKNPQGKSIENSTPAVLTSSSGNNDIDSTCQKAAENYKRFLPQLIGAISGNQDKLNSSQQKQLDGVSGVSGIIGQSGFIEQFKQQCVNQWGTYGSAMQCMAMATDMNGFIGCSAQIKSMLGGSLMK